MNSVEKIADRFGTRTISGIESDDVCTGLDQSLHIGHKRCNSHRAALQVALYQADQRCLCRLPHRMDVFVSLDPQGDGATLNGSKAEGGDYVRSIHRTARHRLAGNNQSAAECVNDHRESLSSERDTRSIPVLQVINHWSMMIAQ